MRRPINPYCETAYRPSLYVTVGRLGPQQISVVSCFGTKKAYEPNVEQILTTAELSNIDSAASRGDMSSLISLLQDESAKPAGNNFPIP